MMQAIETLYHQGIRVTKDDILVLSAWNSVSGLQILVSGRGITDKGSLVKEAYILTPSSDRTENTVKYKLTDGYLLSLSGLIISGTARRGQCFVRVGIETAVGDKLKVWTLLAADYLTNEASLGWPGARILSAVEGPGLIRRVLGTDPGAGSEISETVPTNTLWILHGVQYTLVTDATVANRVSDLVIDDGTNEVFRAFSFFNHTASKTVIYQRAAYGTRGDAPPDYRGIFSSIPFGLRLRAGWRIRTDTQALQAGDNYSAPILYIEELLSG